MAGGEKTQRELLLEIEELRRQLEEAEQAIEAIRSGEVDALVVSGPEGERIFTLKGVDYSYRALIEEMQEGAATLAADGVILYCNQHLAQMLKTPLNQLIGSPLGNFIAPASKGSFEALLQEGSRKSSRAELAFRASDGALMPVYVSVNVLRLEDSTILCLVATDLTEQKRSEEIIAAGKLAASIIDHASEAVVVCDAEERITHASQMAQQFCGENLLLRHFDELFNLRIASWQGKHSGKKQETRERFSITKCLSGHRIHNIEAEFTGKDGRLIYLLLSAGALTGEGEKIIGCVVTMVDITERKLMEEALQREKDFVRNIVDTAQAIILILDKEGRILEFNKYMEQVSGYCLDEVRNKDWFTTFLPERDRESIRKLFAQAIDDVQTKGNVNSIIDKGGHERYIEWYDKTLKDASGNTIGLIAIGQDITERKRIEESLHRSEQNFRDSIENSPLGMRIVTADGETLYANKAILDVYGYSSIEELKTTPTRKRYTAESYAQHQERKEKRRRGEFVPSNYEIGIVRKDGEVRYLSVSRGEVQWNGGRQFQVVYQDITDRKNVEEMLSASEERFRKIIESAPFGYYRVGGDGLWEYVNPVWERMHGYSYKEVVGKPFEITQTEDMVEQSKELVRQSLSGETITGEFSRLRKDGSVEYHSFNIQPVYHGREVVAIEGFINDITGHKEAEETIKRQLSEITSYYDNAPIGLAVLDTELRFLRINNTLAEINGIPAAVHVGRFVKDIVPALEPQAREVTSEIIKTGKAIRNIEFTGETQAQPGVNRSWLESWHPLKDEDEKIVGFIVMVQEITERKQAEEALQQSEEKYRTILQEMQDSYFEVDLAGNITFANDATCQNLGYPREELLRMNYRDFTAEEDIKQVYQTFNEVYRTGKPNKGFLWKVIRKDGSTGFADASISLLLNQRGEIIGFRGLSRDITDRKLAEEERRQMELKAQVTSRLASVGEMAAGVAHEINNPLTGVTGYAQLLMDREDIPPDIRADLEAINDGARRVAGIVQRLLAFSRQTRPERKLVEINELIESTLILRAYHLRVNSIEVITRLAPELLETVVDPGQIQQVLLNLIVNAETEMKLAHGKGKLTITTEKSDNVIKIYVKDNGPGIKPEAMDRIFDPFFTTRETGQGTGLGLSLCYGIIAEHKGRLYVESQPGKGATFIVELPVIIEVVPPEQTETVVKKSKKVAKVRILAVDDEQIVRDIINRVLTGEGHRVETVDNAAEVLEKIESQKYDLILVDVKMPGMSGVELYKRIQKIDKSLAQKVVFITGDVMGADTEKFLAKTKVTHIDKPFDARQLIREVHRALSAGQ